MRAKIEAVISQEVIETLETLAFIFAMPSDGGTAEDFFGKVVGLAEFKGPFSGKMVLAMSAEALPELAGNMLGVDDPDEISETDRHDAMKECINIVCGNILPVLAGKTAVFDISPPEIRGDADDMAAAVLKGGWGDPAAVVGLALDDGGCEIYLFLEGDLSLLESD
jgi:CheY-specific phosphatase CheX